MLSVNMFVMQSLFIAGVDRNVFMLALSFNSWMAVSNSQAFESKSWQKNPFRSSDFSDHWSSVWVFYSMWIVNAVLLFHLLNGVACLKATWLPDQRHWGRGELFSCSEVKRMSATIKINTLTWQVQFSYKGPFWKHTDICWPEVMSSPIRKFGLH